ncbi:hypothetical protein [Ramlibacter albus]|uniref:SMP-30/Gluconolactonase/LRE-like region domain-containing protein n=1 Tax=Ramlibacter albus TaxID=2079448 RepID=A0A923M746_9BURK|nr:hypothetical protein [Ramlibacter albus]MBC5765210.1 hypothetical protein [Ramlibacter albus]
MKTISTPLVLLLFCAVLASCGGGGDPTPAPAAPPAAQAASPYGGSGITPPGPESEGLSLVAGRLRGAEQGRGVLDGGIRYQDGVLGLELASPAALPDGSLLARGRFINGSSVTLFRVQLDGTVKSLPGPWDQERTCPGLLGCIDVDISSLAVSPDGRAWINSTGTGQLYVIDAAGTILSSAPFEKHASNFAVDAAGNLYYLDAAGTLKRRAADGSVTALPAQLGSAFARQLAVDASGRLFAASGTAIERYVAGTGFVLVAGSPAESAHADGPAASARFKAITGIAIDRAGNIFASDARTIRRVSADGTVSTVAGIPEGQFTTVTWGPLPGSIAAPRSLTLLPQGVVFATISELVSVLMLAKVPVAP